jgi:nucleotide-binding universal stress UspA family protein
VTGTTPEQRLSMKVLAAYTPTPEGRAALRRAAEEARLRDAALVVVYYVRVAVAMGDVSGEFRAVERDLERQRAEWDRAGLTVAVHATMGAKAASSEVLQVAEDEAVDLIVIGLRKRSPVGKFVMGSTAQEVLLEATCPVLALKREEA